MDIKKLVNQHHRNAVSDPTLYATISESHSHQWSNGNRELRGREHAKSADPAMYHPTLPPFSSILSDTERRGRAVGDHSYFGTSTQSSPTDMYPRHHSQAQQIPGHSFTHPPLNTAPAYSRQDGPYSSHSSSHSSSTVSSTPTRYSISSGPSTSAERNSGSDDADDDEDEDESEYDEGSTPLPPYPSNPQTPSLQETGYPIAYLADAGSIVQAPQLLEGAEFVCEDCGVSYSRAPDLRRHKASIHNDQDSREKVVNTWPCEICGQVLLSSHGYQGHMRRHYDERPFICEAQFCGKAFHDSATLARHRRTHSTEHKFECDFCGRRFKRKDNLNTHRKKHQVGGDAINPNLLRKPVTRLANGTDASPSPGPYPYNDVAMSSPPYQQSAPPYVPTRGADGNERSRSRGHSNPGYPQYSRDPEPWMVTQAPPYPQPSPQYSRMSTGRQSDSPMIVTGAAVPTPRVGSSYVKMEEESDRGYGNRSRMNSMASPVKETRGW